MNPGNPQSVRLSLRMPERWHDKVTDRKLSVWLQSIPNKLPNDPGGGSFRRSFAFSAVEIRLLKREARIRRLGPATFLRSLMATHLDSTERRKSYRVFPAMPVGHQRMSPINTGFGNTVEGVQPPPMLQRERADKAEFEKYVTELERIAKSGAPESGEAQWRLARIRSV